MMAAFCCSDFKHWEGWFSVYKMLKPFLHDAKVVVREMSDSEVSGEEGSLCIDTKRAKADTPKKKGGGVGKGRKAGRRGKGQAQPESDGPPKPGDIVWAKVMGFNFWPAKVGFRSKKCFMYS